MPPPASAQVDAIFFVRNVHVIGFNAEYGYLGIQFTDTEKLIVGSVVTDSPVAKSGIKEGDLIRKVDGTLFTTVSDLNEYILLKRPGEGIKLTIRRDDQDLEIDVTLGRRPMGE